MLTFLYQNIVSDVVQTTCIPPEKTLFLFNAKMKTCMCHVHELSLGNINFSDSINSYIIKKKKLYICNAG